MKGRNIMKKFCVTLLLLAMFCVSTSAEEFTTWDIDSMIRPELKQYLADKPGRIINLETLPALRKALTIQPEALPKNERVNVRKDRVAVAGQSAGGGLTARDFNIFAWNLYISDVSGDVPAYASPSIAEDLSGLLPAYIMVGTLDPFRDEAITYAQRLMQADVPVELHVIPGTTHGFEAIFTDAEFSVKTVNEYVNALSEAMR